MSFIKTPKQYEASELIGKHQYILLYGGSRSGKTILILYAIVQRAINFKKSRHAVLRFRFNDVKTSIGMDTLPKLLDIMQVPYELNRSDWVFSFINGSEIWLCGLDDKNRVEKILGREYSTIYINEASQVSYHAYTTALTRLAENAGMRNLCMIDCNPPEKSHWLYKLFIAKQQPDTELPLKHPEQYGSILMNPSDNPHLTDEYINGVLEALPDRQKRRFKYGEWLDKRAGALWSMDIIERYRVDSVPDTILRAVVGVDPAVTSTEKSDETGIIVVGMSADGEYYVYDDRSLIATPAEWGLEVVKIYNYHQLDLIVGETNQGGDMVESNIKNIDPTVNYKGVRATRGKALRAEPIAALYELGKVHHVGYFPELESQMSEWAPGDNDSPDRVDALVWAITELMGGIKPSGLVINNPIVNPNSSPYAVRSKPPAFGGISGSNTAIRRWQ